MNFDKDDLAGSGILGDRQRAGASLADIDPMNIDRTVSNIHVFNKGENLHQGHQLIVVIIFCIKRK